MHHSGMTPRLAAVLSPAEFSAAELCALRLDCEVYPVDRCFSPIDTPPGIDLRAAALAAILPPRIIVERRSAAWVWGALATPPRSHEVCARIGARTRPPASLRLVLREVVLAENELLRLAGIEVTTPLRTILDLARFSDRFGPAEAATVSALMRAGGLAASDCIDGVLIRRNLPNKRLAIERLERVPLLASAGADPIDVVDGIDASHGVEHPVEVGRIPHLEDEATEGKAIA